MRTFSYQKRDHSSSASDQSSVVKSNSTPSTPQGGGSHLHTESRFSEGSPLMEQLSEPREDREALEDISHEMEIPEVHKRYFHYQIQFLLSVLQYFFALVPRLAIK